MRSLRRSLFRMKSYSVFCKSALKSIYFQYTGLLQSHFAFGFNFLFVGISHGILYFLSLNPMLGIWRICYCAFPAPLSVWADNVQWIHIFQKIFKLELLVFVLILPINDNDPSLCLCLVPLPDNFRFETHCRLSSFYILHLKCRYPKTYSGYKWDRSHNIFFFPALWKHVHNSIQRQVSGKEETNVFSKLKRQT